MKERMERVRQREKEQISTVDILGKRFVQRWDDYALQTDDGRYLRADKPLTRQELIPAVRAILDSSPSV